MKLWAKVRFTEQENAEYLIRAFFKEFNSESSIVIRGEEAKVEVIFKDSLPIALIEAINNCYVLEFNYGKALGEYSGDETKQEEAEEETSERTEQVVAEEETSKQIEQSAAEETSEQTVQVVTVKQTSQQTEPPQRKRGRTKKTESTKVVANVKTVNVPVLEELAKKSTSFEHFVKLVAEWLEMGERQEFFVNLVNVGTELEKMSWKELEKAFNNKGIFYREWDKIWVGQQVSKKLKDYSVTMLPLLNAMKQYKDYSFGHEQSNENFTERATEETVTVAEEETSSEVEETTPKNRVRYILTAMGLEKKNAQEQQEIFEIANTAVRVGRMSFDIIFLKANIPMESSMQARMNFSKFINDFVSKYDSDKKVKLLDFLKQLQEIVMLESEIESFAD